MSEASVYDLLRDSKSFGSWTIECETEPCLSRETSISQRSPYITLLPSVSIPKWTDVTTIAAYDRAVTINKCPGEEPFRLFFSGTPCQLHCCSGGTLFNSHKTNMSCILYQAKEIFCCQGITVLSNVNDSNRASWHRQHTYLAVAPSVRPSIYHGLSYTGSQGAGAYPSIIGWTGRLFITRLTYNDSPAQSHLYLQAIWSN